MSLVTPNGTALRALRELRGYTLRELAHLTGLDHSYLSRLERELTQGSKDSIERIAQALQVPPPDITRGEAVSTDTITTTLTDRKVPHPATTEGAYFHYTAAEAAEFLPLNARQLRERVHRREIPFSEITRSIHFTGLDIREITEQYRVRPIGETKTKKAA